MRCFWPPEKGGTHVADQALVAHRHLRDVVVDGGETCGGFDAQWIRFRVEAGDVVGDGTGE
jgi:hypothetical protein